MVRVTFVVARSCALVMLQLNSAHHTHTHTYTHTEADAQMAYLAHTGEAHAVITEDSDLLAYGCPRVSVCVLFWMAGR